MMQLNDHIIGKNCCKWRHEANSTNVKTLLQIICDEFLENVLYFTGYRLVMNDDDVLLLMILLYYIVVRILNTIESKFLWKWNYSIYIITHKLFSWKYMHL